MLNSHTTIRLTPQRVTLLRPIFWWHLLLFGRDINNFQSRRDCTLDSHTAQSWSVSTRFLINSLWIMGGDYNLTYIYLRRISSFSHHYPWQGFPWLLIKRSRNVVLPLFIRSGTHDPHRINNLLGDTLTSSFIEFISSLPLLRLNYGQFKFSDWDAHLDRGVMSWIISILLFIT